MWKSETEALESNQNQLPSPCLIRMRRLALPSQEGRASAVLCLQQSTEGLGHVVQRLERRIANPLVVGSSPTVPAPPGIPADAHFTVAQDRIIRAVNQCGKYIQD